MAAARCDCTLCGSVQAVIACAGLSERAPFVWLVRVCYIIGTHAAHGHHTEGVEGAHGRRPWRTCRGRQQGELLVLSSPSVKFNFKYDSWQVWVSGFASRSQKPDP